MNETANGAVKSKTIIGNGAGILGLVYFWNSPEMQTIPDNVKYIILAILGANMLLRFFTGKSLQEKGKKLPDSTLLNTIQTALRDGYQSDDMKKIVLSMSREVFLSMLNERDTIDEMRRALRVVPKKDDMGKHTAAALIKKSAQVDRKTLAAMSDKLKAAEARINMLEKKKKDDYFELELEPLDEQTDPRERIPHPS